MTHPHVPYRLSRRRFLTASGLVVVAAACGPGEGGDGAESTEGVGAAAPETTFTEPATQLSGDLRILLWSHFVPSHDEWFDPFVKEWGEQVGVNVIVDHISTAEVVPRIGSEIAAGEGHDIIQHIAPLAQFEPSTEDLSDVVQEAERRHGKMLDLCRRSSFNPTTEKYYALAPGWVPDPGDYRRSLWEQVGLPQGPASWDELLEGGAEIRDSHDAPMGLGMSQEIDSNMAGRALLWSFGASVQDESENVAINSDATIAAVEFMTELFQKTMTDEVFAWNAASNNQGLIAGDLSYILNSISAYRTAQEANPEVAEDIFFSKALQGPSQALVAQHVMYNWIVPKHAQNIDAAKEFLLHYTGNFPRVSYESKLYDFPAFPDLVPDLDTWLGDDPFGSQPSDKLSVLKDAVDWCTNVGHPGPASGAVGEVFDTFVVPNMFAKAARGEASPQQAVEEAERAVTAVFDKWRQQGLIGGGSA